MIEVVGMDGLNIEIQKHNYLKMILGGIIDVEHWRDGEMIWSGVSHNASVAAGRNNMLDVMFHGSSQTATWYLGLIKSYASFADGDTLASHAGWTESTDYSDPAARGEWTEGAASSSAITNATRVEFTMNATVTINGLFLASVNSGTSGTLFSEGLFSEGNRACVSGDILKLKYTLTLANA